MKKVLIVAAAAGLMTLAACSPAATNNTAEPANVEEANAMVYDNLATDAVVDANATTDANMADMNMSGNSM
jgi:hypothetical protein